MTELDESIFNILRYGGGKIISNKDEFKIQIPRYNNPEKYSQMIEEKNKLKSAIYNISTLLNRRILINTEYEVDTLPYVIKIRKYANGITESEDGFTYYILDKSKIDWVQIDNILDNLLKAKEYRIIEPGTYNFTINRLKYKIDTDKFNIK